jgi:hypothetical protein
MSGFVGWTDHRADLALLLPDVVQVFPASSDLVDAVAAATLPRMLRLAEPTYTTFGSEAATAMEPIEEIGWSSKIGFQSMPPSLRLPDAARGGGRVVDERIAENPGDPRHARPPPARAAGTSYP